MKIDDYRKIVHQDIAIACNVNSSKETEEFLVYTTGLLINGEEFDDFIESHCEGVTRRNGYYAIDGYSIDETDGSCCIKGLQIVNGGQTTASISNTLLTAKKGDKNGFSIRKNHI